MSSYLAKAGVPAGKVIFITPPPIHEAAWEKECKLKGSFTCTLVSPLKLIECLFAPQAVLSID